MLTRFFIGNVSYSLNEDSLAALLSELGIAVKSVRIVRDRESGTPRGFGFFEVEAASPKLIVQTVDGALIGGRPVRVAVADRQPDRRDVGGGGDRRAPRQARRCGSA